MATFYESYLGYEETFLESRNGEFGSYTSHTYRDPLEELKEFYEEEDRVRKAERRRRVSQAN